MTVEALRRHRPDAEVLSDGLGSAEEENHLVVTADASVRWRVVAAGSGRSIAALPTPVASGLLPYEDLAPYAASSLELLRAEHEAEGTATQTVAGNVGAAWNLEIAMSCDIGEVVVTFRGGGLAYTDTSTFGCDWGGGTILLPSPVPSGTDTEIVVDAPAGTSWRLIAFDHASDIRPPIDRELALPPTEPGQTTQGGFLGVLPPAPWYAFSTEVMSVDPGTTFAVAYRCEGVGSIHVAVDGTSQDATCTEGSLSFTPSGVGPSTMTLTSDHTVRINLELRSTATR